jgi:uncharacterized protein YkwD
MRPRTYRWRASCPGRHAVSLFAALSLIILGPAPAAAAPVGDCQAGAGWAASLAGPAAEVVALVNAHRTSRGLAPLAVSPTLTAAAEWKARHMATYGYMGHEDPAPPVERTAAERIQACGYPAGALVGENVAEGFPTPAGVMQGWLESSGHRDNMERSAFTATGVGVAQSASGSMYWAQSFGSVADVGATVPPPRTPPDGAPETPVPRSGTRIAAPLVPPVDVRACRRARRGRLAATCRIVVHAAPATVRARLVRHGRTLARGRVRARTPGAVRVRLRAARRLRTGQAQLRLHLGTTFVRSGVRLR